MTDLLTRYAQVEQQHLFASTADYRKERGQIFTPSDVALFMASLFSKIPERFCFLDPGAGAGALSVALCQRVSALRSTRAIEAHCYENDASLIPLLEENLRNCKTVLREHGHSFTYLIHDEDFIEANSPSLHRQTRFDCPPVSKDYDAVIMNPPYFKLRKDSAAAKLMAKVVHGQPNAYAFFLALAAQLLRENGELVAITPRSFCNGLYFRGFRRWFFQQVALDHVHLFESRTETFKEANVLQESIITKAHRMGSAPPTITVTNSFGRDFNHLEPSHLPANRVVDISTRDCMVRIPATQEDCEIIDAVESLPSRFDDELCISTGPVVMFRATEFLLVRVGGTSSVPLLQAHNVKPFVVTWPVDKSGKPAAFKHTSDSAQLLVRSTQYVLLKRFSAKEERRRLTAGCFLSTTIAGSHVAIENHLNYIYHNRRELSVDEVYGTAAVFNSVLMDRYFRVISGNTQVNATEIRTLYFPALSTAAEIGRQVRQLATPAPSDVERIVLELLGIDGALMKHLLRLAA